MYIASHTLQFIFTQTKGTLMIVQDLFSSFHYYMGIVLLFSSLNIVQFLESQTKFLVLYNFEN